MLLGQAFKGQGVFHPVFGFGCVHRTEDKEATALFMNGERTVPIKELDLATRWATAEAEIDHLEWDGNKSCWLAVRKGADATEDD